MNVLLTQPLSSNSVVSSPVLEAALPTTRQFAGILDITGEIAQPHDTAPPGVEIARSERTYVPWHLRYDRRAAVRTSLRVVFVVVVAIDQLPLRVKISQPVLCFSWSRRAASPQRSLSRPQNVAKTGFPRINRVVLY